MKMLALMGLMLVGAHGESVKATLADGFDFPCGKPDGEGYYIARGVRLRAPIHYGEDWNGKGGGDTDLGDPVCAIGGGIVIWAYDVHGGWGNVVIVRHAYRDPADLQVKFVDSLYGHLNEMKVKVGQEVVRGELVGTIGSNRGMYPAHLHLEVRYNLNTGMMRDSVDRNFSNWAVPSDFIRQHRKLKSAWLKVDMPVGTLPEYRGYRGL